MRKEKDPDPYLWLMDPDREEQKHADPADPDPVPQHCLVPFYNSITWSEELGYLLNPNYRVLNIIMLLTWGKDLSQDKDQPLPDTAVLNTTCCLPEARICPRTRTSLCLTQLSWTSTCFWPEARICPRTRTSLCLTQLSWTLGRMSSILRAEACSCSAEAVVETWKILQDFY